MSIVADENRRLDARLAAALEAPWRPVVAISDGCKINGRIWDCPQPNASRRDVVMVHGRNATLHWWTALAPLLATSGRVVAMDSSGAGDSDWRDFYSMSLFGAEPAAIADAAGLIDPVIIGHSFGGFISMKAVEAAPKRYSGLVIVDTRMSRAVNEIETQRRLPTQAKRIYSDRESILARFRLLPEQTPLVPALAAYVAEHAVRHSAEGWIWKFDGSEIDMSDGVTDIEALSAIADGMSGPVAYVYGSRSSLIREADLRVARRLSRNVQVEIINDAAHHIMLDKPLELLDAINRLLTRASAG